MKNFIGVILLAVLVVSGCGKEEPRVPVKIKFGNSDASTALSAANACQIKASIHDTSDTGVLYLVAHYPEGIQDYYLLNNVYFDLKAFEAGSAAVSASVIDFSQAQTTFSIRPRKGVRFSVNGVIYRHKYFDSSSDSSPANGWPAVGVVPGGTWNACYRSAVTSSQLGSTDGSEYPIVVLGMTAPIDITSANQSINLNSFEYFRAPVDSLGSNGTNVDDNALPAACTTGLCGDVVRGFDGSVYLNGTTNTVGTRTSRTLSASTNFSSVQLRLLNGSASIAAPFQVSFVDESALSAAPYSNNGWLPFPCSYRDQGTLPNDNVSSFTMNDGSVCKGHHFYVGNAFRAAAGDDKRFNIWPLFPDRTYRLVISTYVDMTSKSSPSDIPFVSDEQLLSNALVFNTGFKQKVCIVCDIRGVGPSGISRFGINYLGNSSCTTAGNTKTTPISGPDCRRPTAADFAVVNCQMDPSGGAGC